MKLVYWPADILKRVSEPLTKAPDGGLVVAMKAVMKQHGGAGLSAVQIGELQRLIVVDSGALGPSVFVNPIMLEGSAAMVKRREGCLSVPGFFEDIMRHESIAISYRDENFELHENVVFSGFIGHVLQHEMEHLDGKLYLDHLPRAKRSTILGNMMKLRKAGKLR
jgi:peptide deformylase